MRALADDFAEHGPEAISEARAKDPVGYLRVVASLMPKELTLTRPLEDLNDDELRDALDALQRYLAIEGDSRRVETKEGGEPAKALQALPEAG